MASYHVRVHVDSLRFLRSVFGECAGEDVWVVGVRVGTEPVRREETLGLATGPENVRVARVMGQGERERGREGGRGRERVREKAYS